MSKKLSRLPNSFVYFKKTSKAIAVRKSNLRSLLMSYLKTWKEILFLNMVFFCSSAMAVTLSFGEAEFIGPEKKLFFSSSVKSISVSQDSNLSRVIREGAEKIQDVQKINSINIESDSSQDINGTHINKALKESLRLFPNIKHLDLTQLDVKEALLPILQGTEFESLKLSETGITNDILEKLQENKTLQYLDIGENSIDDNGVIKIKEKFPNLRYLDLTATHITLKGLAEVTDCKSLHHIAIGENDKLDDSCEIFEEENDFAKRLADKILPWRTLTFCGNALTYEVIRIIVRHSPNLEFIAFSGDGANRWQYEGLPLITKHIASNTILEQALTEKEEKILTTTQETLPQELKLKLEEVHSIQKVLTVLADDFENISDSLPFKVLKLPLKETGIFQLFDIVLKNVVNTQKSFERW